MHAARDLKQPTSAARPQRLWEREVPWQGERPAALATSDCQGLTRMGVRVVWHLFGHLGGAGAQLPGVSDVSQHKGKPAKAHAQVQKRV